MDHNVLRVQSIHKRHKVRRKTLFLFPQAALLALQEENMEASVIKHAYFLRSLDNMSPSLTAQQIQSYHKGPR